jgi:hypothetical protein
MRRRLVAFTAFILLLTFASSGEAWQVNVKNSCTYDIAIVVEGEHLFWRSRDCSVTVGPGQTGACVMPGGICPVKIHGGYGYKVDPNKGGVEGPIDCSSAGVACCWNVNVEAVQKDPYWCGLVIR